MRGVRPVCAAVMVLALLASGCTTMTTAAQHLLPPIWMELTPAPDARDVSPARLPMVRADLGRLTRVTLVGRHGAVVKGNLNPARTRWVAARKLGYGKRYTLIARGVGQNGEPTVRRSTFTTVSPARRLSLTPALSDGVTVGVGMPISLQFSGPVRRKAVAERAMRVTTSPRTEGGFHWFSDEWVVWRPKEYWRPGTEVTLEAEIYGRHLGNGSYGAFDVSRSMTIGRKLVAVASGKTHHMRVWINGRMVKRMPISMGKPTHPTPRGIYTVMSEHRGYTFDSSTYGVPITAPEGYRIRVTHATRMSYSGIFYHSAPWSAGAQGNTNVSHGCLNLSTAHADWLMRHSKPGDLITVTGSGGPRLDPTDGFSVWQLPWRKWRHQRAKHHRINRPGRRRPS